MSSLAALEAACSHLRKMIVNARLWRRIFMAKMEMEPGLQVCVKAAVLGICHCLVRIRIRGSVPLTNGPGSNSGSDAFLQ